MSLDFFSIKERQLKNDTIEIYPDWLVKKSKDLMVRGKNFYAVWDEQKGLWSADEYDLRRLVDQELTNYKEELLKKKDCPIKVRYMQDFSTSSWMQYRNYLGHLSDNSHQLDTCLTFANTKVEKKDYVSRRLPYPLEAGPCDAYDELMRTLYSDEEREKLEWAIGAIVAGDAKDIQKFVVLYGPPGTGKSTFLNIIQKLFDGYYTSFEARSLTSSNNAFAMEMFKSNPLVAIDHDSDMSRIEDNTKLNSIVSHDMMTINEKHKPVYMARANCFLFVGTNKPVKITEAKSGVIRRLIDVRPTGEKVPANKYHALMERIDFELGAIAFKCLAIYRKMGKNYYSNYRPLDMILQTDVFFNFVEANYFLFNEQNGVTLTQAYDMYKTYCDESLVEFKLPRHKFREELKNYFETFCDVTRVDGKQVRSYYSGLIKSKFTGGEKITSEEAHPTWLCLDSPGSIFDEMFGDLPAQYASDKDTPLNKWINVRTKLSDLDTTKTHYVKLPPNQIVIDLDLKDETGKKSPEKNAEAAAKFPPTYAEYSKSGAGIHLHYNYEGDPSKLSSLIEEGIEVLVSTGDKALRRRLTKCNTFPIATINGGLPLKEEKPLINKNAVKSEKGLRELIKRNLNKEIHPATKPSIDFIFQILEEAYKNGLHYDLTDMRPKVLTFALNSTHQAPYCYSVVNKMHFSSDEPSPNVEGYKDDRLVFFDVEVFPNLLVVNWKFQGKNVPCIHMINPEPKEIEQLFNFRLVGFNNRRYDNHILYARHIGYSIEEIYTLSQRIIGESRNALFGEAYNISFADIYDFSSKKQSLKKFQIELGIHHQELGFPFDKPVPEELWNLVVEYCDNDVVSTEAVFENRKEDFTARQILADLSGLTVNDTTQQHTAKIIFGNDPKPQDKFVYTDLREMFPGYVFAEGKSTYRGELVGEGGYVYAEPGSYEKVGLWDVVSMHPSSTELLDLFGPYTKKFSELKAARVAIKHKDFEKAKGMLGGVLEKYLTSKEQADSLAYALKIVINIVYGLTSASFPNKFKDPRNIDNIVAKRGALFMIDLKHAVQEQGYKVVHIKTDSIKIPNADKKIGDFIKAFGEKYGYEFEHEALFDRFALVNDAVYIARTASEEECLTDYGYVPSENKKHPEEWEATGAQFAQPYVFKTLFSKEPITFDDLCETKTVTSFLYLDMNEGLKDDEHKYSFVGRAGSFCPIRPGCGGGLLLREKDGKFNSATGAKGFRWLEAEVVKNLHKEDCIDLEYYRRLVDEARDDVSKFVDFEWFVAKKGE